nr:MAG TPA_asm: hypothetical protein [Caudoviricetes sp.]
MQAWLFPSCYEEHYHRHSMNACCNALAGLLSSGFKQSQHFCRFLYSFDSLCYRFAFSENTAVLLDEKLIFQRAVLNERNRLFCGCCVVVQGGKQVESNLFCRCDF